MWGGRGTQRGLLELSHITYKVIPKAHYKQAGASADIHRFTFYPFSLYLPLQGGPSIDVDKRWKEHQGKEKQKAQLT